jgi:hypothetical protein
MANQNNIEGEVERKVRELSDKVFERFNPLKPGKLERMYVNDEGEEYIEKSHLKEWV